MDLLNLLVNTMTTDSSVKNLVKKTGGSEEQVQNAVASAVPVLLKSMTNNVQTKKGANSLLEALTQHTSEDTIESQIENADEDDGNAIINHILGKNTKTVVSGLSKQSGMKANQITSLLGNIAPALLSGLSAATKQASTANNGAVDLSSLLTLFGGGSGGGLAGMLLSSLLGGGSSSKNTSSSGGSLLGSLLGGLGGSTATAKKTTTKKTSSSRGGSLLSTLLGGGKSAPEPEPEDTSSFDGSALLGALLNAMK